MLSTRKRIQRNSHNIPVEDLNRNFTLTCISTENISSDNIELILIGSFQNFTASVSNHKYNHATQVNSLASILRRSRNEQNILTWQLNTEPIIHVDQVQELMDAQVEKTWFGHTATYFPTVNAIVVYGGGDKEGAYDSERALWVLTLGPTGLLRDDHDKMADKEQQEKQNEKRGIKGEKNSYGETFI